MIKKQHFKGFVLSGILLAIVLPLLAISANTHASPVSYPVKNLQINSVDNTSVTASWELDEREAADVTPQYIVTVVTAAGQKVFIQIASDVTHFDSRAIGETVLPGLDVSLLPNYELLPGVDYELWVQPLQWGGEGTSPLSKVSFTTTGEGSNAPFDIYFTEHVDTLSLSPAYDWAMFIDGQDFWGHDVSTVDALERSIVSLNGQPLKLCAPVVSGGMSAQELIDAFNGTYPNIADIVTDDVPCYSPMNTNIRPKLVVVMLPDTFDRNAPGYLSFDGGPNVGFNGWGGSSPIVPTVRINGASPSNTTLSIPSRPTFTGTAAPLARVKVAVHSDPVYCETTADASGNWSCTLPQSLPAGSHTAYVTVTTLDNEVIELGPYAVTVGETVTDVLPPNTGLAQQSPTALIVLGVTGIVLAGAGILAFRRHH